MMYGFDSSGMIRGVLERKVRFIVYCLLFIVYLAGLVLFLFMLGLFTIGITDRHSIIDLFFVLD